MFRHVFALLADAAVSVDMRTALLTLASALLTAIVHFARADQPTPLNLPVAVRGIIAIVSGSLIAGIDAVLHGTQFGPAVVVALATSAGPLLAFIAGLFPSKPPPPNSSAEPPAASPSNDRQPSSSSMLVAAACAALALAGCGGSLQQTALTYAQHAEAVLSVIRAAVETAFVVAPPKPEVAASIDSLIGDVASADEALIRIAEGHDKAAGGDIGTAVTSLAKAYSDLIAALHAAGIVLPSGAAGNGEPMYRFARTGKPVPTLAELTRGSS